MASVINQIKLGNVEYAIAASAYAECSTAANTPAKTVTICTDGDTTNTAFTLVKGVSVQVKFTNGNTADMPTLNVNGTGAKMLLYKDLADLPLIAHNVYTFVYDGEYWRLVGELDTDTNTTYTFNGAVSTIKDNNLTANRALISNANGKVAVSGVTSTELGYLDGVTSNVQGQLDNITDSISDIEQAMLIKYNTNVFEDFGTKTAFEVYSTEKGAQSAADAGVATVIRAGDLYVENRTNGTNAFLTPNYLNFSDQAGEGTDYGMYGIKRGRESDYISIPVAAKTNDVFATQGWVEQNGGGGASSHTHGQLTNDGALSTANSVVVTDLNKKVIASTITTSELQHLSGVTSNIQTQLDGKAASSHGTHVSFTTTTPKADGTAAVGTATTVSRSDHVHPTDTSRASSTHTHGNLANGGTLGTASRVVITDANKKITPSTVTTTELGYLSGVTSNIQTQLNSKAPFDGITVYAGGLASSTDLELSSGDSGDVTIRSLDQDGGDQAHARLTTEFINLSKMEPINDEESSHIMMYNDQLDISVRGQANTTEDYDSEITSGISMSSHNITIGDIDGIDNDPEYDKMNVVIAADNVQINTSSARINSARIITADDFRYDSSTGVLFINTL